MTTVEAVMDVLAVTPCHITGMHDPEHHLKYLCSEQKAELLDKVLAVLGLTFKELPGRLHEGCGWCHNVPSQEKYRERLRQTWAWAGVTLTDELAAPAPDVPAPEDAERVYAVLTDTLEPWQKVVPLLSTPEMKYFPTERYWAALTALGDRVIIRDISAARAPDRCPACGGIVGADDCEDCGWTP